MTNWFLVGFGVGIAFVVWLLVQLRRRAVQKDNPHYFLRYDGFHEVVRFESLKQFSIRRGGSVEGWGLKDGDVLDVYGDGSWLISASLVKDLSKQLKEQVWVTKQDLISGVQAVIKAKKAAGAKQ